MLPNSLGLVLAASATVAFAPAPKERGVALGLFANSESYDYAELIDEIHRTTGATHLSISWVYWQDDLRATQIKRVPTWSPADGQITASIKRAKQLGLHVTAFPIVRLIRSKPDQWRGKIAPSSEADWWRSYTAYILRCAQLAEAAGADRLSIGSELVTREGMRGRWVELIERLRVDRSGLELMYSANWDHHRPVAFWDKVDVIGMTAYFELTKDLEPTLESLVAAWTPVRDDLARWSAEIGRPIVITEIGYPSLDGAASWPWDETRKAPVDLEEQRIAYEAFVRAFAGQPFVAGVYWWNWFGFGGPNDTSYSPRGKPAARIIERWYKGSRSP